MYRNSHKKLIQPQKPEKQLNSSVNFCNFSWTAGTLKDNDHQVQEGQCRNDHCYPHKILNYTGGQKA